MQIKQLVFVLFLSLSTMVDANHPGENIDQYMADKEKFFQPINSPEAPAFELVNTNGETVRLSDFSNKIVVLNFIFTRCTDVCPLHTTLLKQAQEMVNQTPMKEMVQFISVTTDPVNDTPSLLASYAKSHAIDLSNWMLLTASEDLPDSSTRQLAEAYNIRFMPLDNGQQLHGVVTHVIDQGGRFAAKFHGLKVNPLNMVLYINGLINNTHQNSASQANSGWWDKIKALIR